MQNKLFCKAAATALAVFMSLSICVPKVQARVQSNSLPKVQANYAPKVQTNNDTKSDKSNILANPNEGNAAGSSIKLADTPSSTPSIAVSKSQVTANDASEAITITNGSTEKDAWVGLYEEDQTPGEVGSMWYWYLQDSTDEEKYLNIQNGNGTANIDLNSNPSKKVQAGKTYKLVLFKDDKNDYVSEASVTFEVVDKATPKINLSKTTNINTGETITMEASCLEVNSSSWVGIYNQSDAVDTSTVPIWKENLSDLSGTGLNSNGDGNFNLDLSKVSNLKANSKYRVVLFKDAATIEAEENFDTDLDLSKTTTVTLSESKVTMNDKLNITFQNGKPDAYLGLYSSSDTPSEGNSKLPQTKLSDIVPSGSGTYSLDLSTLKSSGIDLAPGSYNIIVYEVINGTYTIEGSASVNVISSPTIKVSKSVVEAGDPTEDITIEDGSTEPDAWVGLYEENQVPGTVGSMYYWYLADASSGARYLNIQNGNGKATINLNSNADKKIQPGKTYKLVLFDDDKNDYVSHASVSFQVVDKIGPSITLSKSTGVGLQEALNAQIKFASVDSNAWVGVFNQSDATDGTKPPLWKDTLSSLTNGTLLDADGAGSFSLDLSKISNLQVNSSYKLVLFKDGGNSNVIASTNFDTMLPSIKLDSADYNLGDKVTVNVANASLNKNAWVGIYNKGKVPGQDEAPIWYESLADLNIVNGSGSFALDTMQCNLKAGEAYSLVLFKDGAFKVDSSVDFNIDGGQLLSNATLTGIEVNGNLLSDFDSSTNAYNIKLPYGTTLVPTIAAIASVVGAKVEVTESPSVNGTAVIKVTALDGKTTNSYAVNFSVDTKVPTNLNDANIVNVRVNAAAVNKQVTVSGNINTGSGKNIILKCLDPYGNLVNLDETISLNNGSFTFNFTTDDVQIGNYTIIIGGDEVQKPCQQFFCFIASGPTPTPTPMPNPPGETRQVPVVLGNGEAQNTVAQVNVTRTTDVDGKNKDTLEFSEDNASVTVQKALETNTNSAAIDITDIPGNNADKIEIDIPKESTKLLGDNNISLEADTEKAKVELPKETLAALEGQDAQIQINEVEDSSQVSQNNQTVLNLAAGSTIISAPIEIKANYSGLTKITIPFKAGQLPSKDKLDKFLSSLAVVIEHSDGENVVDKGTIVYDEKGNPIGISIWVDKFSDFTIVELPENYFDGKTTYIPYKVAPDKVWSVEFSKEADKATITPENVYVLDSEGNKVDINISYDSNNVLKIAPVNKYTAGETYSLYISKKVTSKDGKALVNNLKYNFTVAQ